MRSDQTLLFERLGINDVKSRIIAACNGTEYFLASLIAIALIDRVGRRKLMLFGAIGQCLTMVLLAILGSIDNAASQVVSAVLLFVFNSFFAIGWLGMTWLYVRRCYLGFAINVAERGFFFLSLSPLRLSAYVSELPPMH